MEIQRGQNGFEEYRCPRFVGDDIIHYPEMFGNREKAMSNKLTKLNEDLAYEQIMYCTNCKVD